MSNLQIASPAKINLALRVYERREDGYHRIETVMLKLDLHDDVTIEIGDGNRIQSCVPGIPEEKNLAVRAAKAYLEATGMQKKIEITIQKRIPIGGGLGGGSSNAASVLFALQEEFWAIDAKQLLQIAKSLGADIPFFLDPPALVFAGGIGDKLTFWNSVPERPVILCNPGFPVSTPEAYQALQRTLTYSHPGGSSFAPQQGPKNWSDLERLFEIGNDLQEVVEKKYPEILRIRKRLEEAGSSFSQMSGSGSTVFGLFDSAEKAESAMLSLDPSWQSILTHTLST